MSIGAVRRSASFQPYASRKQSPAVPKHSIFCHLDLHSDIARTVSWTPLALFALSPAEIPAARKSSHLMSAFQIIHVSPPNCASISHVVFLRKSELRAQAQSRVTSSP